MNLINPQADERSQHCAASAPVALARILVALDQSDYANQAMKQVMRLAGSAQGTITGIHAYAASLHDRRFRQMEGGLPERYRRETEMEHQRDVHEDLIGMGLGLISDSYHDAAETLSKRGNVAFERLSPEGKNYACLSAEMNSGNYDVLAMGALGLGAVAGSTIGTVCERVVRRAAIDVFVAKDRHRPIGDGPIVVAKDGSAKSFSALKTALDIGRRLAIPVHVVAAYDPYYHYVAFNKISTVLDDGVAKIYQAHLEVATKVAEAEGASIQTALVAGKPYQAIRKYVAEEDASLLVIGKTGIHADDGLDIGGTAENLLRMLPCHIWIGQAEFTPPMDVVAENTIMWSDEAEALIERAPEFVRGMARTAVIRAAQAEGHTFITTRFVQAAMARMMPGGDPHDASSDTGERQGFERLDWSDEVRDMLDQIADTLIRDNVGLRAEKQAHRDASATVQVGHVAPFMAEAALTPGADRIIWRAASLARLQRVPEAFRDQVRSGIESFARQRDLSVIDAEIEDEAFAASRMAMCPVDPKSDPT